MYRFLRWYEAQKPIAKAILICGFCLFLVLLFFAVSACVGSFLSAVQQIGTGENRTIWYWGLVSSKGKPITIVSYSILLIITIVSFTVTYRNRVKTSDERGVHYMEDNTYGSSRWMQEEEIENSFSVSDISETTTTIYGQLTDEGEAVVGWKPNAVGGTGNRNVIVLASMGSGKSFGYVRTELIQATLRGNSFVVTDPSAELYTDLANWLIKRGVNVKVLNLAEPAYSEFWNCLEETISPETERLDSTRLNDFVTIYMENSGDPGSNKKKVKDFWDNSAKNLLKAVIGYTAYEHETPIVNAFARLYLAIKHLKDGSSDPIYIRMTTDFNSFEWCRNAIRRAAMEEGEDLNYIEKLLSDITNHASDKPYTIGEVFKHITHFTEAEQGMKLLPAWHPARLAYDMYLTNDTDLVKKSALQGLQLRFELFTDDKIKEVLSHDGIRLSDINLKQSAYFVIMSDKSIATMPISSLFFSFLFKDAQDVYDREAQISKEKGILNPCLDLVTMLDEFFSIGIIGGSPESFGVTMSNSRKRHIYISIIVQAYGQIADLYGPEIRDVIQGGCSTLLFLGGNDPETCEFISEFASGEATVLAEMHKKLTGVLNTGTPTDLTVRSDRRNLLTVDEARRWKNQVLLVKQGEFPLKLNPFPWIQHPMHDDIDMRPISIYSNVRKLSDRLEDIKEAQLLNDSTQIFNEITALNMNVDIETGEIKEDPKEALVSSESLLSMLDLSDWDKEPAELHKGTRHSVNTSKNKTAKNNKSSSPLK